MRCGHGREEGKASVCRVSGDSQHQLGPPAFVILLSLTQHAHDLGEAGDQAVMIPRLAKWPHHLPVEDRCIIHQEVIPGAQEEGG